MSEGSGQSAVGSEEGSGQSAVRSGQSAVGSEVDSPLPVGEVQGVRAEAEPKRTRRRKKAEAQPAETAETAPEAVAETPEAPTEALPEAPEEPKPKRTRRRKKAEAQPTETVEPAPETAEVAPAEIETPPEAETPTKKRTRRRKKATVVEEAPAEPEVPPPPPVRHPFVKVVFEGGVPRIVVGERAYRPQFFFGNPHTPEASTRVLQQIQMAVESGVELFSLLVTLPARSTGAIEAFDQVRYWTAMVRELLPDAQILWRIVPAPVGNWQSEYPEAVVRYADGTIGGPSICADRWWQVVQEQLNALVQLIEQEDEGANTLGYHLDWGEWFQPASGGYDTSDSALQAFREWLRRQYKGDSVVLRACWFNGEVSFATATIPTYQPSNSHKQFYHPRREGRYIDYHRFLSDTTARRILSLAQGVKTVSQGRALVGVPYGYVLEWRHPFAGHFALSQILRSDAIDFLSAPLTYSDRLPGGTGAFALPVDSVHLHGKLFLAEEDYRTPFGKSPRLSESATGHHLGTTHAELANVEDDYNPTLHTAEAVRQVQARSNAQALTFAYGQVWMDLWGEGWLMNPLAWENAQALRNLWDWRERIDQSPPELAVIIDPESTRYVRVGSTLMERMVVQAREAILRSGVSAGFYLMEDIVRRDFPPAKVVLFLNSWRMARSARDAIRRRLQRDGRVLVWLYAGSLFHGHRDALAGARETMGVAIARQPWGSVQGTQIVNKAHPLARALGIERLGEPEACEPSFYAIVETGETIGEYIDTGLPSLAVCDHGTWKAVFSGERILTPEMVRAFVQWAGGHVWFDTNDVVHARPPFLHIHARRAGMRTVRLPEPMAIYDTTEGGFISENRTTHRLFLQEGESRLLLVGERAQIEAMLQGERIRVELAPLTTEEPTPEPTTAEPAEVAPLVEWQDTILEPIRLEESPFIVDEESDFALAETIAPIEEALEEEPAPAEAPVKSKRRANRRTRRRGRGRTKATANEPALPPIEVPIQWRRPTEEDGK